MSDLMIGLAEVMRAEIKALDTIANNAANMNTPGYRAEHSALTNANFISRISNPNATMINEDLSVNNMQPLNLAVAKNVQKNDGSVKTTGVSNHLALSGDAWFVVEKDGLNYITRNGKFELNSMGQLITTSGAVVVGEQGPIDGLQTGFSITSDGKVIQSGGQTNKLLIVTTSDDVTIKSLSDALYEASSYVPAETNSYALISGAYEMSNGDTATDMIRLMQTTRHIETLQRSISAYDQLMNVGINQLGK